MAIPYHTHTFEIPFATREDVVAGIAEDKVVVPSALGSAAVENAAAFATAEQGARADRAIDASRKITAGSGLAGGGSLASDVVLSLDAATQRLLAAAETAVQKAALGLLAFRDRVGIGDIDAAGVPDHATVLYGDGVWRIPPAESGSGGSSGIGSDGMRVSVYDPQRVAADAFSMDHMREGVAAKVMTAAERAKLAGLPADAVSAKTKIQPGRGLAGGGALGGDLTLGITDDLIVAIRKGETAVQKSELGELAFRQKVKISDIAAANQPGSATFLRGDGTWAEAQSPGKGIPPGAIMAFAMSSPPSGWLVCDGRAVSRATYRDLFDAIQTGWGAGNGLSTFNLPDLRGSFLRGRDNAVTVAGKTAGDSGTETMGMADEAAGRQSVALRDVAILYCIRH